MLYFKELAATECILAGRRRLRALGAVSTEALDAESPEELIDSVPLHLRSRDLPRKGGGKYGYAIAGGSILDGGTVYSDASISSSRSHGILLVRMSLSLR